MGNIALYRLIMLIYVQHKIIQIIKNIDLLIVTFTFFVKETFFIFIKP